MVYELSDEQYERLMDACKSVPYLVMDGMPPVSPRERAERVWQALGQELGFDWKTASPVPGKSDRFFSATPSRPTADQPVTESKEKL